MVSHKKRLTCPLPQKNSLKISQWIANFFDEDLPGQGPGGKLFATLATQIMELHHIPLDGHQQDSQHIRDYFFRADKNEHQHAGNAIIR